MKVLGLSTLFLVIFTSTSFAQSEARGREKKPIEMAVTNLQIEAKNINQALAEIAYKYSVPISLEVAIDEDLSKGLSVQLKKGTLADVLDNIVKQKPSYTWEAMETTISVFPKTGFRDPLLQTVLEIRIDHFVVPKGTARITFQRALTQTPELKYVLASYRVRPLIEAFSSYEIKPFGRDFSLDVENVSVRSILDNVIKNSQTKYWFINREGENREYLLINF